MFSKALFKQSCKANGTMWGIITFAVCFMLACVMLISGNGNIGEVKNSIQDAIIIKEVDAQLEKRALTYYANAVDGLERFDAAFAAGAQDTLACLAWCAQMPRADAFEDAAQYAAAQQQWQQAQPQATTQAGQDYAEAVQTWLAALPQQTHFTQPEDYAQALAQWQAASPATQEQAAAAAYAAACEALRDALLRQAEEAGYAEDSNEAQELLGSVMAALNPDGLFDAFYTENGAPLPEAYDVRTLLEQLALGGADEYLSSTARSDMRQTRAAECAAVFLAGNMTESENVEALMEALSSYGVTAEKYDSFGYTYDSIKRMGKTAIVTYQGRLDYELELLEDAYADGEFADRAHYLRALADTRQRLADEISTSFLSTLPEAVSDALEEIGQADLYTLIVGSIFYKLAGLLLPIIYMIMTSNNLIAGQVDSGSMAYVLCTSTKRSTVVFTQAVYLIGSLLAMFCLTTATGCVCLTLVPEEIALTGGNLILLNVGAFLVLLPLSGLCFLTSCVFDRSRRSMAIGGGLSIFALVAAMLGLFGSPVIPSVVRLDALNYFNYATIISLFDVISIIDGTNAYLWKFAILGGAGLLGYIVGARRFIRKDLPL